MKIDTSIYIIYDIKKKYIVIGIYRNEVTQFKSEKKKNNCQYFQLIIGVVFV